MCLIRTRVTGTVLIWWMYFQVVSCQLVKVYFCSPQCLLSLWMDDL